MTDEEWMAYLRREIERMLVDASENKLRLTLVVLRTAT